jgi:hypothetical protein
MLAEDPGRTQPQLGIDNAAAQTRIVSKARIRLDSRKSLRSFKGIICDDISEFESYMPSHAVGLSQVRSPAIVMHRARWILRRIEHWKAPRRSDFMPPMMPPPAERPASVGAQGRGCRSERLCDRPWKSAAEKDWSPGQIRTDRSDPPSCRCLPENRGQKIGRLSIHWKTWRRAVHNDAAVRAACVGVRLRWPSWLH